MQHFKDTFARDANSRAATLGVHADALSVNCSTLTLSGPLDACIAAVERPFKACGFCMSLDVTPLHALRFGKLRHIIHSARLFSSCQLSRLSGELAATPLEVYMRH